MWAAATHLVHRCKVLLNRVLRDAVAKVNLHHANDAVEQLDHHQWRHFGIHSSQEEHVEPQNADQIVHRRGNDGRHILRGRGNTTYTHEWHVEAHGREATRRNKVYSVGQHTFRDLYFEASSQKNSATVRPVTPRQCFSMSTWL